jgi:hypothetical protein
MIGALVEPYEVLMLTLLLAAEMLVLWRLGDEVAGRMFAMSQRSLLHKLAVYPLLAPGVAVHETAHAAAALACGVQVKKFVPFWPVQDGDGWRFGYVQPGPCSTGQNAVIASAPLWMTPVLLYVTGCAAVSGVQFGQSPFAMVAAAAGQLTDPWTAAWAWVFVSSALANFPSSVDVQAMRPVLPVVGLVFTGALGWTLFNPAAAALLWPVSALALLLAAPAAVCVLWWAALAVRR